MSKELVRMLLASAVVSAFGVWLDMGILTAAGVVLLALAARVWWVKSV